MKIIVTPLLLILCLVLALWLRRWKAGIVVLLIGATLSGIATIFPVKEYLEEKARVDKHVGKPFAEGRVHFSKDHLVADIRVDSTFLDEALEVLEPESPIGIRLIPIDSADARNDTRSWEVSWVNPHQTVSESIPLTVSLNPAKQENWFYQISSSINYENAAILRIKETDLQADYSGELTFFFTGDGIERLGQKLLFDIGLNLLGIAIIFGIGGASGLIKKRWLEKDTA